MAASGKNGISLYRASSTSLTHVGTYYRRWAETFPNIGNINESVR